MYEREIKFPIKKLEIALTFLLLFYFMEVGRELPSPLPTLLNIITYVVVLAFVVLHWRRILYLLTRDKSLLLLIVIACISIFWTAVPSQTMITTRAIIRSTLFGTYLAARYTIKEQMKFLFWVLTIAAIMSLIIGVVMPERGLAAEVWQGIFPHKNELGRAMTLGAIISLLIIVYDRSLTWIASVALILEILLIILTQSRTSFVAIVILCAIVPLLELARKKYRTRTALLSLLILITGITMALILFNLEFLLVDVLGKNLEFNGRLPLWKLLVEKGMERPWLGYGYDGFWQSDAGVFVINNSWASLTIKPEQGFNCHNGFLELWVQLGLLGVVVYLVNLVSVFGRIGLLMVKHPVIENFYMLIFLVFICIFNLAVGNTILDSRMTFWIIYVAVVLSSALQLERMKKITDFTPNNRQKLNKLESFV